MFEVTSFVSIFRTYPAMATHLVKCSDQMVLAMSIDVKIGQSLCMSSCFLHVLVMHVHVVAVGHDRCKHMCLSFAQLPLFSLKQGHFDADFSKFVDVVKYQCHRYLHKQDGGHPYGAAASPAASCRRTGKLIQKGQRNVPEFSGIVVLKLFYLASWHSASLVFSIYAAVCAQCQGVPVH